MHAMSNKNVVQLIYSHGFPRYEVSMTVVGCSKRTVFSAFRHCLLNLQSYFW